MMLNCNTGQAEMFVMHTSALRTTLRTNDSNTPTSLSLFPAPKFWYNNGCADPAVQSEHRSYEAIEKLAPVIPSGNPQHSLSSVG